MEQIENIKKLLKKEGLRVTQGRIAVAECLIKKQGHFFSHEDIYLKIQQSKKYQCDPASVYRTLSKFEELGVVKKSSFKNGAARYNFSEKQLTKSQNHQHFFKCLSCDVIHPFKDCLVSKKEKELEKKGYKNLTHHLEITGLCPSCNKK